MSIDVPQMIGPESEALFNTAVEDCLAYAPNELMRKIVLRSLSLILAQYIAREDGRGAVVQFFRDMAEAYE